MRVLAATTAGAGHFAGLLPFARACVRAGHEVRVAAPACFAATVEGAGLVHQPFPDSDPAALGAVYGRLQALSMDEAADVVNQEIFGRINRDAALPAMRAAAADWRPDVILREPAEVSSYVIATELGIPHIQTNIGLGSMDDRMLPLFDVVADEVGVSSAGLRSAPRWTTVPPSFDVAATPPTGSVTHARDVAPAADAPVTPLPSWWSGDSEAPLVYVTFGSVAAGMGLFPGLYDRVLQQLAEVPARVLLTLGEAGTPEQLASVPSNVHVERWWPQRDVLPHAALVVGHGGFGTTQAAIAAAVPQVVLPLFSFDQFLNADRVAEVGVGTALVDGAPATRRAGEIRPNGPAATDRLAEAVTSALQSAAPRARASAIAAEVRSLQDVDACVGALPGLCG